MTVWAVFNGGHGSYSPGDVHNPRDVESFASLRAAGVELWWRHRGARSYYPCVGDDASLHVYISDPSAGTDGPAYEYPDRIITIGPRGGIRMERA